MCVLGWDIYTGAMTISVPLGKLERLRDTPSTGANGRRVLLRSVGGQLIRQSVEPSSHRAYTSGFRSWAAFRGLMGEAEYFDAAVSDIDQIQELLEFVAWCASEGNQAGTIASKLSAVLPVSYTHLTLPTIYSV